MVTLEIEMVSNNEGYGELILEDWTTYRIQIKKAKSKTPFLKDWAIKKAFSKEELIELEFVRSSLTTQELKEFFKHPWIKYVEEVQMW